MKKATTACLAALIVSLSTFGESLWLSKSNRERSLFADRVASSVGDILTIEIDESTTISASMSKQSSGTSNANLGIKNFFNLDLGKTFGENAVEYSNSGPGNIGTGSITNVQSVASSASVMVVDELPNGNLIVEGARQQIVAGETMYVIVRGIVRPDDISGNNTVVSSRIGNARIEFLDKGAIAAAQKEGWITKLLNATNIW